MTTFPEHLHDVMEWLDTEPPTVLDPDMARLAIQLIKLGGELGEAFDAFEGVTGLNPRKGVYKRPEDLDDEICDVWITAAVALARRRGGAKEALAYFNQYVNGRNGRIRVLLDCARMRAKPAT